MEDDNFIHFLGFCYQNGKMQVPITCFISFIFVQNKHCFFAFSSSRLFTMKISHRLVTREHFSSREWRCKFWSHDLFGWEMSSLYIYIYILVHLVKSRWFKVSSCFLANPNYNLSCDKRFPFVPFLFRSKYIR